MNKKLLKGALALFASIFMAISCNNNNTNPDGDKGTPSVSKSDVETFLKRLDSDESLTAKDSTLADGNTFAVTLSATTQTKDVDDISKAIVAKLTEANNIQAVKAEDITDDRLTVAGDDKAVTYTIKLKAKSGYNIGSFGTVKVVVTPESSKKWKKIEVKKTDIEAKIKEALGENVGGLKTTTVEASGASKKLTITITDSTFAGASKYEVVKTALENKYDNVKLTLAELGIATEAKSIVTSKSGQDLIGTLESCKLSALYSIDNSIGSGMTSGVDTVEIKLNATDNWS